MNDLTDTILKVAYEKFGIFMVKPFQLLVMQRILEQDSNLYEKRDQIVILPTGTGKSLCFLLPATLCSGITVIVYPLLALMNDQMNKLKSLGIDCVCLRGGQNASDRKEVYAKLSNGAKILITNPETLSNARIISRLQKYKISLFVCDEAHVISQWGKDFRPSYLELKSIIPKLRPKQIMAFTATASEQTLQDIIQCLFTQKPLVVMGDADRENIIYSAYPVNIREFGVINLLKDCQKPAIVFCSTRDLTYKLCRLCKLNMKTVPMRYYHAGLTKEEREAIEQWFLNSNDGVLFATCAYGMGIDKPNIRTVIHHTLPSSIEAYLQESGRAGRDGKTSYSYVLISKEDNNSKNLLKQIFTGNECRRQKLLLTLGQTKEECSGCDVCNNTVRKEPIENEIIIRAVKRSPLKYTKPLLRSILAGNRNIMFVPKERRIDPSFGLMQDADEQLLDQVISLLISKDGPLHEFKFFYRIPRLFYWKKKRVANLQPVDNIKNLLNF